MKIILFIVTISLFISGCNKEEVNKGALVQISGAYNGIIPCKDCEGINYEIELNEDFTYRERMIYLGKKIKPIASTGKWKLEGTNIVTLYKQSSEMSRFEFSKGNLIMLDGSGKRIEGPMADKYILIPGGIQLYGDPHRDTTATSADSSVKSKDTSAKIPSAINSDTASIKGLWNLKEINGQKPEECNYMTGIPNLEINQADNKFTSNSGCNRTNGGVQIRDSLISFSKFFSTRMTCPGTGEKEYISTMTSVDSYKIENGMLSLKAAGKTVLKFSR